MRRPAIKHKLKKSAGVVAVEFALILPILLVVTLALVDFARALQANMMLINLSREGANLASRGALPLNTSSQDIIRSLAATAPPLNMRESGMMYITKIMGNKDANGFVQNVVLEQYRWDDRTNGLGWNHSGYAPTSQVWSCGSWAVDGSCSGIPAPSSAPTVNLMVGQLYDGEVIYAVESFYKFNMLFGGLNLGLVTIPIIGPNLRSLTVF